MAFTSGRDHAGPDDGHSVQIPLKSGEIRHVQLYDRPGDDMRKNKGDQWKVSFSSFGFSCVKTGQIANVAIMKSSDDGSVEHRVHSDLC